MSLLYLIRHGQAGPRHDYDRLSDLGHRQTLLLGSYLRAEGLAGLPAVSGALRRQRQSAANALGADAAVAVDPRWNEFDLDGVYAHFAPLLAADDARFAAAWASMGPHGDRFCDYAVVGAWMHGRYPFAGESWAAFEDRVRAVLAETPAPALVFTSAAPTVIAVAAAMGAAPLEVLPMAGHLHHSSVTAIHHAAGKLTLAAFNQIPHLASPGLRTVY